MLQVFIGVVEDYKGKMDMESFTFPLVKVDDNKCQLDVCLKLYAKEAITAAVYKFTDHFFIHQKLDSSDENIVCIVFESKTGSPVNDALVKQFCNELIDQQVRVNVNDKFGKIRDMIVEEAFRPVSK